MIELPESCVLEQQLTKELEGRVIKSAVAGKSPHGFAFFMGEPADYAGKLEGKRIGRTRHYGGRVEIEVEDMRLEFFDGVNMTLLAADAKRPDKHQLLLELDDGRALVCKVQMYGGLMAYMPGELDDNMYHTVAREKPDPLTNAFDRTYFDKMLAVNGGGKLSAKAFLATEQRIPGLGNGVLQDILFVAQIHPKSKMGKLDADDMDNMYGAVKNTLKEMTEAGGRDTEKDAYGTPGGYKTVMSKANKALVCPACGDGVKKEA